MRREAAPGRLVTLRRRPPSTHSSAAERMVDDGVSTRVGKFLAHLDGLSGGVEPQFWPIESTALGHHGVTAVGYRDMVEDGLLIGVTYGLSLTRQESWRVGRPELTTSVLRRVQSPCL